MFDPISWICGEICSVAGVVFSVICAYPERDPPMFWLSVSVFLRLEAVDNGRESESVMLAQLQMSKGQVGDP